MLELFSFIFNNAFLIILIVVAIILYKQYDKLKKQNIKIKSKFEDRLYPYLDEKFKSYISIVEELKKSHTIEEHLIELNRIHKILEPCIDGTVNDYVNVSNKVNKYRLSNSIDTKRYPEFDQLNNFATFTEEEMNSVDNGIALARSEYNTQAYRYNEKSLNFPWQYLTSLLKMPTQYIIFDAPKKDNYEKDFEVFEEVEPEIDSLANLNKQLMRRENVLMEEKKDEIPKEVEIEHNDNVLKPSINIDEMDSNETSE